MVDGLDFSLRIHYCFENKQSLEEMAQILHLGKNSYSILHLTTF